MKLIVRLQNYINQRMLMILLVFSIIPVVGFGTIIYIMGTNVIKSDIDKLSRSSLDQVKEQVDLTIGQIEQNVNQFSMQSNVVGLSNIAASPSLGSIQSSNVLRSDLAALISSHAAIESIYYYHAAQQTLITSTVVTDIGSGEITDLGWLPVLEREAQQAKISFWIPGRWLKDNDSSSKKLITYVRFTPLFASGTKAALIVNMNPSTIVRMIQRLPIADEGGVALFTPDGSFILQGGNLPRLSSADNEQIFAAYKKLAGGGKQAIELRFSGDNYQLAFAKASNGWIFGALVPTNKLFAQVNEIKRFIILITGVLASLAFILSLFGIKQLQGGLRRISNALFRRDHGTSTSSSLLQHNIGGIEREISYLLDEVQEANIRWQEHLPMLKNYYLFSVLLNHTALSDKLARQQEQDGAFFPHPLFSVFAIEMDAPQVGDRFVPSDEPLFLFAVGQITGELLKETNDAEVMVTRKNVIIILNLPEGSEEHGIAHIADRLRVEIRNHLKQTITVGVGAIVSQFNDISSSYYDAMRLLQQNWMKVGNETLISHISANGLSSPALDYPLEAEERILEAIRAVDAKLAEEELRQFAACLNDRQTSPHLMKTFYLQLLVSIIRLLQNYEEDLRLIFAERSPFSEFMALDSQQAVQNWFGVEIIGRAVDYLGSRRKHRKLELISTAVQIIEQTYRADLSLQMVADQLKVSTPTLSLLFKEIKGENFIDYVTRFRVDKIKAYLRDTNLNIGQIAEEVGYNNAQQLIRVFKKSEGRTPGDYRKLFDEMPPSRS